MEKIISRRCDVQSVPDSYKFPPETRPGQLVFPKCEGLPIIDLGGEERSHDRSIIIKQIIKAFQEFGVFQVINHGISGRLIEEVFEVSEELFELPAEDMASLYSDDQSWSCRFHAGVDYDNEGVHYWRDCFRHYCHPLEEHVQSWPQKPARYKEVAGSFALEARKLSMWVLEAIREGLGLEEETFSKELSEIQVMAINKYPPCPDPTLTLGLPKHSDVNLITLILQGDPEHHGFQVLMDGQWLTVQPLHNAFVINIGLALQMISNGKLKSDVHRVVSNKNVTRTTVVTAIHSSRGSRIEPAKELVNESNPPLYKSVIYKDFVKTYMVDVYNGVPPLDLYKL